MSHQSNADAALFQSMVVVNLGKTSRTIRASALALPPECAPLLFDAAANLSRVVELCHESGDQPICHQMHLPIGGKS